MFEDATPNELKQLFIESEEGAFEEIPDMTLEELVRFYKWASVIVMANSEQHVRLIEQNDGFGQEIFFSLFRFLKALLAEVEYRIREKKID